MNRKTKKEINTAIAGVYELMVSLQESLQSHLDAENEKFDNMPEGLQSSENGQKMSELIDALTSTTDDLEAACTSLSEFCDEHLST